MENARFILKTNFKARLDALREEFNNYKGAELGYIGLTWSAERELVYADGTAIPYKPSAPAGLEGRASPPYSSYGGEVIRDSLTNTSRLNLPPTMDLTAWCLLGYKIIVDGKKEKTLTNERGARLYLYY